MKNLIYIKQKLFEKLSIPFTLPSCSITYKKPSISILKNYYKITFINKNITKSVNFISL